MRRSYPKISYVTPVYNQVEYIEQTILSVINQDYPNYEYIVVDGGSTDGTLDIIRKYESRIFKWVSEPDTGMYNALNKGFHLTSGEIMGWINGDDILLPGAFFNMYKLFDDLPQVNWIQGLNSFLNAKGHLINTQVPKKFSLVKFLNGDFKWIQQESTFWRRDLWEKAGGKLDDRLKLAGDFELWFRFFQFTKLYNTSIPIGAWRKREGQLSASQLENYLAEVEQIINSYERNDALDRRLFRVKFYDRVITFLDKFKIFNTDALVIKRKEAYNLGRLEIVYFDDKNKFVVP